MRLSSRYLLFASVSALLGCLIAQAAVTDPVGAIGHTIPAHDGNETTFAVLNIGFYKEVIYAGEISTVSGADVTDSSASWSSDDYLLTDSAGDYSYYLEVTSGTYEGLIIPIAGNTTDTITLNEDVSYLNADVGLPLTYNIRQFYTIGDIFSSDNSLYSLRSSGNASDSDSIYLLNSSGEFELYYYQSAPPFAGGNGWRLVGNSSTDFSDRIISSNVIAIARNGSTVGAEIILVSSGSVKLGDQRQPIFNGFNLIGYSYPLDTTLGTSGIDPADLVSGGTAAESDIFYLLNTATGNFDLYFYQTAPVFAGGTGWRIVGNSSTDQSGKVISAGEGFFVLRRSTGIDWIDTQPF